MKLEKGAFFLLILSALLGFWMGQNKKEEIKIAQIEGIAPNRSYPLLENKSFAVILYAHNSSLWCERALSSIFEQEHEACRVIFVDDASSDHTLEKAKQFAVGNQLEKKVSWIENKSKIGPVASIYLALDQCLDEEIVLPLDATDWFCHRWVLTKLNLAYQNPDVWLALGETIDYPSYARSDPKDPKFLTFYAALFKKIELTDLFQEGRFSQSKKVYYSPLLQLSGGRVRPFSEPLVFSNKAYRSN
ncbi:MAG: hypothetical protein A3E80_01495 [Chlamydiae bacterium RIFCSPHIGHO2_12_FULL_49_9]|nr:MAG: hypothetical protein A3E80_01495 [Chlamydiae bacterium RIFCSPHIGHO2_12_FULL_49_9]